MAAASRPTAPASAAAAPSRCACRCGRGRKSRRRRTRRRRPSSPGRAACRYWWWTITRTRRARWGEGLTLLGHTVKVVFSAPAALAVAPMFQPQVGLLDIGLPGMDGYELAQRLREQPGAAELRLVAVTGYGQDADRKQARAAGFEQHLTKPVDLARLEKLLQHQRTPGLRRAT
ncbi:response regulator [Duganella sp. P38]|uniref:response regulator n=1 Tax=Duganella sp. P38 TaxID=3423949 RepID=UPI003D7A1721